MYTSVVLLSMSLVLSFSLSYCSLFVLLILIAVIMPLSFLLGLALLSCCLCCVVMCYGWARGCGCSCCFWWLVVGCCFCCCCFYPKKTRLVHGLLLAHSEALRTVKQMFPSNSRHSVYLDDRSWNGHLDVAQVGKKGIRKLGLESQQSRLQLYRKGSAASRPPEQASPG